MFTKHVYFQIFKKSKPRSWTSFVPNFRLMSQKMRSVSLQPTRSMGRGWIQIQLLPLYLNLPVSTPWSLNPPIPTLNLPSPPPRCGFNPAPGSWGLQLALLAKTVVAAVPNFSSRWYTGTLDFHLLFRCSEPYISSFQNIYEVDILFNNSLGSKFYIWFEFNL